MKKVLLSIVGILGIFGCCLGEEYTITFNLGNDVILYDYISNSSKVGNFSYSYLGESKSTDLPNLPFLYLTGFNSLDTINLKSLCFYNNNRNNIYYFFNNPSISGKVSYDYNLCFNLTGYDLTVNPIPLFYSLNTNLSSFYIYLHYQFSNSLSYYQYSFNDSNYLQAYKFSLPTLNNDLSDFSFYYSGYGSYNRFSIPLSIVIDYVPAPINPKFKVNYGNTSYEYELTDNLTIKLNSPTTLSGTDTYIYDGPTGINLFYNGLSQFYSKDKLYLKSMYWFNNNIFTPICL